MTITTTYRLEDIGASFMKILLGRQWVGRVYQHQETKVWHGRIKQDQGSDLVAAGSTANEAFRNVAALALGYATPADVLANNAAVRAGQRQRRKHVQYVAQEMRDGNFKPFEAMVDRAFGKVR